jgi:thiol-disulfide isomerase/thioredoxin
MGQNERAGRLSEREAARFRLSTGIMSGDSQGAGGALQKYVLPERRHCAGDDMDHRRGFVLAITTGLLAVSTAAPAAERAATSRPIQTAALPDAGPFPSLAGATAWLNSPPLSANELVGKVVLVDIWTYTCINWLRTEPYVRAWASKYKEQGLVVIGVHSPEFEFEKNLDNVRDAATSLRVDYPIALDSEHAIWDAFDNRYWPALYLVDARGRIRYRHFGEGHYAETERAIQQLLVDAGHRSFDRSLVRADGRGVELAADWANLKSPENYVGYERTENFASPAGTVADRPMTYAVPAGLALNHWALGGEWTVESGRAVARKAGARIAYRFHARDVHLVMGSQVRVGSLPFRVLVDGKPPGEAHGEDVDADGRGTVTAQRLYQLVRQKEPVVDRTFEIQFDEPGVEVYAFTFG